jgi:hypothetical protein
LFGTRLFRYSRVISPPAPRARAVATGLALVGTLLSHDAGVLAAVLTVVVLPLLVWNGALVRFARLSALFVLPIALGLLLVWGGIVGAPPGEPLHSDPSEGAWFAITVALRLLTLSAITYLSIGGVEPRRLLATLRGWGLRGDALAATLGTFVVFPELGRRAEQIITARYARGLIGGASTIDRLRHFPFLLRPLMTWSLRSAIQRAELWEHRALVQRLDALDVAEPYSLLASVLLVATSAVWLVLNLILMYYRT